MVHKSQQSENFHLWEQILSFVKEYKNEAELWCKDKPWAIYAIWLPYFAYILVMHLKEPVEYSSWFAPLNLGLHELGHFIFMAFGSFLHAAGGTIFQCSVPIIGIFMFLRQRHYYGPGVMGVWLSTNLFGVATYMADARAQELTLVAPGVGIIPGGEGSDLHDWLKIFGSLGILRWDTTIAFFTRTAATLLMLASIAYLGWLCYRMAFVKQTA